MAGYKKTVIVWAIVSSLGLIVLAGDSFAIFGGQQRARKSATKASAKTPPQEESKTTKASAKTPPKEESKTAEYDLDVGVEKARLGLLGVIPTRFTTLMLSITNRDTRSVTIRKVMVNEEYEISAKGQWHRSSKSQVIFPVILGLGDRLSREIYPYAKEVIYVDIETDSGVQRIKLPPRRATADPEN
jgi:hypothetical protein